MPILDDIMDHEVLGRELKRGLELGYQREQAIIERMIGKRFGPLPLWAKERLAAITPSEAEEIALRLLEEIASWICSTEGPQMPILDDIMDHEVLAGN